MKQQKSIEERVRHQLADYSATSGVTEVGLSPQTDMIKDLGFTSLQGLEFVLDLCDEFAFDFPADFNPFVDDEGRRGRTFGELVQVVQVHLASQGDSNGAK